MELDKRQIDQIVASCRKRLGKPKTYTGTFVPPQQQQGQSCSPQQPSLGQGIAAPTEIPRQGICNASWSPTSNVPSMTGAPKPTFSLESTSKKKPKSKKGFQSEIKNLLKSDKDNAITIEKKTI
jgi:hypothetical protein